MLIILWTDFAIFILLGFLVLFVVNVCRKPHLKLAWRKVYTKPIYLFSLLIILFYVILGVLDSIHLQDQSSANGVLSVLDLLMSPLGSQLEKTYSAPFASYLFNQEIHKFVDTVQWVNVPLQYVAHTDNKYIDLLQKTSFGLLKGFVVFVLLWLLFAKLKTKFVDLPWKTLLFTISGLACLVLICYELMFSYHILGTDKVGYDVFYVTIKSVRTGLVIGSLTTILMLPVAVLFGTLSGYFRGIIDDLIQYVYTTINSIPSVLLIAGAVLVMHNFMYKYATSFTSTLQRDDLRLLVLCAILGMTSWTGLCRLLRGETLKLRSMEYVAAAKVLGVGHITIIFKHIVPNLLHIILISITLDFSALVLAEAVLSYVGVGVSPTTFSWGNMINGARMEMAREPIVWWSLFGSFIMMFTLVLVVNVFSDGVREAFDPKVK